MALTPFQWLTRLTVAMDERAKRLSELREYLDHGGPLPEGAEGCKDAYRAFQKKSRTNFAELVVDAVVERMIPAGLVSPEGETAEKELLSIWRRNRLQLGTADVVRDMAGLACGYMIVERDEQGRALITCERPEQVYSEQTAGRPDLMRAAVKVYRDPVEKIDVAYLHLPGNVYRYTRSLVDFSGVLKEPVSFTGDWEWDESADTETGLNYIPVFPFVNRGGKGEFESHLGVLDRINWVSLQVMVIIALQAYRQRALEMPENGESLPREDGDGKEINYSDMFKPGAGALWELPPGVELWESSETDFTPVLTANKGNITTLAAVTRTPMSTLIPDTANQSAEGAAFAREGLVFKAQDRVERAGDALSRVMGAALGIERGLADIVDEIEVKWLPVERRSLAERADAASKAQDIPWRSRMRDTWGYSEAEIDKMESERAADALNTALAFTPEQNSQAAGGTPAA